MKNNTKVLVTGSQGFIGSHLVKALKNKGYYVIGIDNMVNAITDYGPDELIKEDIREAKSLDKFKENDIKYVFHLAALPRVTYSVENPVETHSVNVDATLTLLMWAHDMGVKKFIFSSSSSVYGKQPRKKFPLKELDAVPNPQNPYAVQKLCAEQYVKVFNEVYNLPTASLRYFNVYGENQDGSHPYATVVAKFLELAKNKKPLTIEGSGKQERDLTYVGDVVDANISAAESQVTGAFNVGSGSSYSVNDIASMIEGDVVGTERKFLPARENDVDYMLADIGRSKLLLNYQPKTSIKEWIKTQLKSASSATASSEK